MLGAAQGSPNDFDGGATVDHPARGFSGNRRYCTIRVFTIRVFRNPNIGNFFVSGVSVSRVSVSRVLYLLELWESFNVQLKYGTIVWARSFDHNGGVAQLVRAAES